MRKIRNILWTSGSIVGLSLISVPAMAFTVPVPEPNTLLLLAGGVAAALIVGKWRGRK